MLSRIKLIYFMLVSRLVNFEQRKNLLNSKTTRWVV
jgi:hypothetical protein